MRPAVDGDQSLMTADVVVIGAGSAGLAAASRLAEAGKRVVVVEQAPRLGGRASTFSDPATGERVDNGQHVLFGCYRETYAFLRRIGSDHRAPLAPSLALPMVDANGRRSDLVCPALPPPWHLVAGVFRWPALAWADRWRVLRVGLTIAQARRVGAEALAARVPAALTVEDWLDRAGQSRRVRDWLWHPLSLAALNQDPTVAEARSFVRVLGELFGPRAEDAAVGLASVPLDELYAEPAAAFVRARGGEIHVGEPATVLLGEDGVVGVRTPKRTVRAPVVISAVPWFAFDSIWADVPPALATVAASARSLGSSPIVTVNLWTDGPVMDVPFVGLVGAEVHWIFDRARITGAGATHLSVVTSGATALAGLTNEEAAARAWRAVQAALPAARGRRLTRSVVVRERRATFSLAPGGPPRPAARTPIAGLYLAGDWTDTGLPATIEGAVQSGHRAAELGLAPRVPDGLTAR